ncbi:zinc finger, CCHC-type containing protein [Tanacetum coccineum]
MRADGKSQMYMIFSQMLKSFNREDLEDLYKLVKAKYESTRPVEDLDLLLWGDLKTMFEPHVEDKIYMLVEKKYPLAPLTLSMMLEKKLIIDYETGVSTAQRLQRKYAKCLLLLVHNCSAEVNAASENMLEVTTASEYQMVVVTENTNNTTIRSILLAEKLIGSNFTNRYRNLRIVLRYKKKMKFVEQPIGPAPDPETADLNTIVKYYESVNLEQEVACLMLSIKAFHACKQEDGQSVSSYLLKIKSYLDTLERLGYAMPKELSVSLILNSLNKDYDQFVQNYNMHNMGKTLAELHAMLKLHEKGIPKKAETPVVLAIREGQDPTPPKRDNPAKNSICHYCKEAGHWRRNCPSYHAELKKRKNASVASTSGIFTIELYDFPNKTWVYDTGCGTHICNTSQGLGESSKLKHGALSLYMGNGMRAVVEAIKSFDLILPSGLIIVLDNCHFAPTVTRGVFSISRLVNNDYIHTFTNYGIYVSKDNVFYFNAIPRDGIYEIDMHNLYLNVSSMYNVSNKRAKHALDSYYLWHCHFGHINKKSIDMLQRDGLLQPTHDESHEKCKSCISGKMAHKPFSHQVERAKDLLGLIHTDVFQNEVENQLGKKIKAIRSDRGREYMSHEFVNHMKSYGIVSQLTPPYTPQYNGVSERRKQTLLDMVQSMMNLTTLPKSFWGYALETVARILNMVPTKKVDRTPYEIWHGKALKLSYLRVWGCEALTMF